jgi:hypothetical protein
VEGDGNVCDYKGEAKEIFVVVKQFGIFIIGVVIQIYT